MFRTIFITDGSEAAFYAAVFRAWKCPSAHIDSAKNFQPLITDEIKTVSQTEEETEEQARRVKSALLQIDARAVSEIRHILASGNIQKEQIAYLYLKEIFRYRAPARDKTYLGCVRAATDVLHAIGKEIEHLKGFIRFRETAAGRYSAAACPPLYRQTCLPVYPARYLPRLRALLQRRLGGKNRSGGSRRPSFRFRRRIRRTVGKLLPERNHPRPHESEAAGSAHAPQIPQIHAGNIMPVPRAAPPFTENVPDDAKTHPRFQGAFFVWFCFICILSPTNKQKNDRENPGRSFTNSQFTLFDFIFLKYPGRI